MAFSFEVNGLGHDFLKTSANILYKRDMTSRETWRHKWGFQKAKGLPKDLSYCKERKRNRMAKAETDNYGLWVS